MRIETLRWVDDHLEMIDQRVLPKEFKYLSFNSGHEVADGIKTMVVRGAPAIGCAAAYGVALEAIRLAREDASLFDRGMDSAFIALGSSRPTAVNLFWALNRMRKVWNSCIDCAPARIAHTLLLEAHKVFADDVETNKALGKFGADLLNDGDCVLTHCNAGALATAGHGTALGIIRSAVETGKSVSVIADETRPFLQGSRLTAWEMVQENIPTTLITDGMAGHLMATGCINVVVVGADRVAINGDVANKIGTYMVAVLAQRHKIPFYVACPLSTIDTSIFDGGQIEIEERNPEEVLNLNGVRLGAQGVSVRNPSFDITPAELITGLVTEKGVIFAPNRQKLEAIFSVKVS